MKMAVIQLHSVSDLAANLAAAHGLMSKAADQGADWLLLPEHFHWAGGTDADKRRTAEAFPDGPGYQMCAAFARERGVYVHAGSLYEAIADDPRVYNTTVVFDRSGAEIARYRKIHLFDITAPDGVGFRESAAVAPGAEPVVYSADGVKIGCSICYDLRFPALFQELVARGAQIIALPAAFTLQTGKDHWEPLIRARAIETQTYFAASATCGAVDRGGRQHWTYGHSMIVDPWGLVVARASDGSGLILHEFDAGRVATVRGDIPVAAHQAAFVRRAS
jgi:deaminated glutathione amidase